MKAYNLEGEIFRREQPDFEVKGKNNFHYGIEITHLYDKNEAEVQLGRSKEYNGSTESMIENLNIILKKKASKSENYKKSDKLILVIRVAGIDISKGDIERLWNQIKVSPNHFDEIWLLLYNKQQRAWNDLLPLKK